MLFVVLPTIVEPAAGMSDAGPMNLAVLAVVALLTWRWWTLDYDVTHPRRRQVLARAALVVSAAAGVLYLPALLCWLAIACRYFDGWQHHAMMPIRLVKASLAWCATGLLIGAAHAWTAVTVTTSPDAIVMLLGCVALSHYVKPAWSKARLGKHCWDWAWHNRTHYLAGSAYAWGWARFVPARSARRVLVVLARLDRPMNIATMLVESAGLIAFLDPRLLIACLVATAGFNLVIALASGIFFWENIAANLLLAAALIHADLPATPLFGVAGAATAAVIVLLACADMVWQPFHLGWWDAPFTARVHWEVETTNGRSYGLYNDFMCPYEREYGRVHGYFLTDEPVLHGHLGIVWDRDLRDHIAASGGDATTMRELKHRYGHVQADAQQVEDHTRYLTSMFTALNHGAHKSPLPRRLRWLKAPGGQLFHWGDLPRYRGREPVQRIVIRYQERFHHPHTHRLEVLTDVVLHELEIPPPQVPPMKKEKYAPSPHRLRRQSRRHPEDVHRPTPGSRLLRVRTQR
ncbi:hypothetical protein [Embleya sp. NPDC005575]|uniref:hypothetical protein n=1 Tax=Embleya sp. NPDC005575 TaxID=3156892 RepID=UPI0033BD89F6